MPLHFWYSIDNNVPKFFMSQSNGNKHNSWNTFTLEDFEISDLQRFIQDTKLPFKEHFVQSAFQNFELSYLTPTPDLIRSGYAYWKLFYRRAHC